METFQETTAAIFPSEYCSEMAGLEQSGAFVRFCQLCGFLPFRVQLESATKRFTFSFFHGVTFWYLLIQFSFYISFIYANVAVSEIAAPRRLFERLFYGYDDLLIFTDLIVCYRIICRCPRLNKVADLLSEFNGTMAPVFDTFSKRAARLYVAIAFLLLWVSSFAYFNSIINSLNSITIQSADRSRHVA